MRGYNRIRRDMTLTINPSETQSAFIRRLELAYAKALELRHNHEAGELYRQLILERKKLNK
jgi:hypothetical protein